MPCYILKAGDTDKVKIGWSDDDVEGRRAALQTAHWEDLTIIRVIEGDAWIERAMHVHFAEQQVRREWFEFVPAMMTFTPTNNPTAAAPESLDPVLADIEQFLVSSKITATSFGKLVARDPLLVHELRKGRECRRALRMKITEFIGSMVSGAAA